MGYNEAIDWIGGPEVITAGVVVRMGGEVNGIMLSVQQIEICQSGVGAYGRQGDRRLQSAHRAGPVPPWWK